MSPKKWAVVMLGVGVLIGVVIGDPPPLMQAEGAAAQLGDYYGQETAYLTAILPGDVWVTASNPRAGEGKVFYITDIVTEGTVSMALPVGFGGMYVSLYPDDTLLLKTPLPLVNSMQMFGPPTVVVLAGYYSTEQPVIEGMPIVP